MVKQRIKSQLQLVLNQKRVAESVLETQLISAMAEQESPTIVLRAEKSVPVENVVKVMDIANRNKFKVILAVKPN